MCRRLTVPFAVLALAACADSPPTATEPLLRPPARVIQIITCEASRAAATVHCAPPLLGGGVSAAIIGGQGSYVQLSGANASYNSGTETFSADFTIQNLLNEAIGTPDGTTPHTDGIRIFFHSGPTVTDGSGTVDVANEDGTGTFTAGGQPYFQYNQVLAKDAISGSKSWQFSVQSTVNTFNWTLYVSTEVQPFLVINEVMVNPNGDPDEGEWFELYNAGTLSVNLQGLVIADSAASGRRPYHEIASSVVIASGGYAVLGENSNTTLNGGVTLDYTYGGALSLANSLDALKLSRVYGTDTLTLDRTQYANTAVSAQSGISRELKNPALDNANMDGSNWANALVTAVYGSGGRGTPKAQNSTFTP
ncbi:MAG TPA: lamin tail domain-containing protein [Longimicrobiaceae bacterium]|nr:lamin tail domain-containing protein [Longimicrobiaceae bacterium]